MPKIATLLYYELCYIQYIGEEDVDPNVNDRSSFTATISNFGDEGCFIFSPTKNTSIACCNIMQLVTVLGYKSVFREQPLYTSPLVFFTKFLPLLVSSIKNSIINVKCWSIVAYLRHIFTYLSNCILFLQSIQELIMTERIIMTETATHVLLT